ncbi:hypothetical protein [Streptomyces sp. NEAU-174]|uniref:hypothetical protein n=1 Tax=Streptomyces sp. NEAU-174 TaxID=3458254 RepID=UPI004044CF17
MQLTFGGPLTLSFPLPSDVAPGTYTIAARLSDQAGTVTWARAVTRAGHDRAGAMY